MSALNDAIAHSLVTSQRLLNRFCEDLKPEEYLHRPCSGGNATAWILGHTDRFKALVVHSRPYDLMAQFASDATFGRSRNYGAEPWVDPSRIDQWSPNRFASNFKTPTLIMHGEKDYRVPYTQGLDLYGVLTAKGVPTRIVVFPDENHWILKAQSAKVWHTEVLDWLDRWLAPAK